MNLVKSCLHPKYLLLTGGALLGFWVVFGFFGFDKVLKFGIRDQTALKRRNEIRGIYLKLPFPLDFRVYFFNVSNPKEVQNGAKPILKEVGPYCYDEFKEKVDVADNDVEDSLTYTQFDTFIFNKNKSGHLSQDDYVTILNPLIVGMVSTVSRDTPALLSIVNKAIDPIFNQPESIYLTIKVKDILFDGMEINCKSKEFPTKAVCTQLKQQIPGIKQSTEKNVFLFSLLGPKNATLGKRFKVLKGIKKSKELGRLIEVDNENGLTLWGTEACNRFRGTDGWIFPPFLTKEEGIWSFSTDLCRSLRLEFIKDTVFKGINLRRYEGTLGDMEHNENETCYCSKVCSKKGLFDLSKCMGVPIIASLPHFLKVDEMYLKQVDGLNPNLDDHILLLYFEALTGTPVGAKKRMQFNLPIQPNSKISLMTSVPEALHPIFWVEESVELEGELLQKLSNIFILIKLEETFKWLGIVAGTVLIGYGGFRYFKNRRGLEITPVQSAKKSDDTVNIKLENHSPNKKKGFINHGMSGEEINKF